MEVFPLGFRDLSHALARVHSIQPDKLYAFESRIKNLQRLGFLPETNTGRGRKASYGIEETFLLALGIELLQLGVTPERVINVINPRRAAIVHELRFASRSGNWIRGNPKLMYLDPRALSDLQDDEAVKAHGGSVNNVRFGTVSDVGNYFARHRRLPPRLAVIDLQKLVTDVLNALQHTLGLRDDDLAAAFQEWGFS